MAENDLKEGDGSRWRHGQGRKTQTQAPNKCVPKIAHSAQQTVPSKRLPLGFALRHRSSACTPVRLNRIQGRVVVRLREDTPFKLPAYRCSR
jgi:hypothetical protein